MITTLSVGVTSANGVPVTIPPDVNVITGFDCLLASTSGFLSTNPNVVYTELQTPVATTYRTDILCMSRTGRVLNIPVISGEVIYCILSTVTTALITFDKI
jgi:hypothetical protein